MAEFIQIIGPVIDRFGVSLAILIVLGITIGRVARWLAPRADQIKERHLTMLDAATSFANSAKTQITEIHTDVRGMRADINELRMRPGCQAFHHESE